MNCRRLQDDWFEYLDGTLPAAARAELDRHLSECQACRQRLEQERELARELSERFRRAAEPLGLPPEVGLRVRAVLAAARPAAAGNQRGGLLRAARRRSSWALGVTACLALLVVVAGSFFLVRGPRPGRIHPEPRLAEDTVLIELSYVVPTYTFRNKQGVVVDSMSYETAVVNQRIPVRRDSHR